MNGISLTASMRSNLLSLQNISGQVSSTQNKLATGNKVNSAIDNPSSYYTALSLNNRADDLNALLDSMGQAISTIKAATTALENAADFLEQASAVATQALETAKIPSKSFFEEKEDVAAVVSTWDELKTAVESGKQGNIVIYGNIEAQDTVTLKAGQNLVGVGYYGIEEPDVDKFSQLNFDLETIGKTEAIKTDADNLTIADLSIKILTRQKTGSIAINLENSKYQILRNIDIFLDTTFQNTDEKIDKASIAIKGGSAINIEGKNSIYVLNMDVNTKFSIGILNSEINMYGKLDVFMPQSKGWALDSMTLNTYGDANLNIKKDGAAIRYMNANLNDDTVINIEASQGLDRGYVNLNDQSKINISAPIALVAPDTYTLQMNINSQSATINTNTDKIFINANKGLTLNSVVGAKIGFNGKLYKAEISVSDNVMNDNAMPKGFDEVLGNTAEIISSLNWLAEQNANRSESYNYENETQKESGNYQEIINQYDSLIKDASYKGVNLLQNDKLSVKFNETNTADLSVQGKDMSSQALGFKTFDWQTQADIADSLAEIASALKSIRNYSAELGNNYSIITTRQDFTESLVNVLTEGADKLTLADMNEESANMLALQTRQQLAINSLSLASQASQSILKLF